MAKFKFEYGVLKFEIEGEEDLIKERSDFIFNNFKSAGAAIVDEIDTDRIENIEKIDSITFLQGCENPDSTLPHLSIFMTEKNFVKDCDIFLGLAYYFEKSKGAREWSVKDIEEMYKNARKSLPKNISQNIRPNFDKGYIDNVSTKGTKTYTFTDKGIEYIESFVNDKEKQKNKSTRKSNKQAITAEMLEENKKICKGDIYTPEQIAILKNCSTQKDVVVWCSNMIISQFGEDYEITYTNISSLAKKFGVSIDDTKVLKVISACKEYYDISKPKYYIFNGVGQEYAKQILSVYKEKIKKEDL